MSENEYNKWVVQYRNTDGKWGGTGTFSADDYKDPEMMARNRYNNLVHAGLADKVEYRLIKVGYTTVEEFKPLKPTLTLKPLGDVAVGEVFYLADFPGRVYQRMNAFSWVDEMTFSSPGLTKLFKREELGGLFSTVAVIHKT